MKRPLTWSHCTRAAWRVVFGNGGSLYLFIAIWPAVSIMLPSRLQLVIRAEKKNTLAYLTMEKKKKIPFECELVLPYELC